MTNSLRKLLLALLFIIVGFTWATNAQAQKKVRFAYPSSADMGDIPSLLAWEQLKKQGIEVVPTFFPKNGVGRSSRRCRRSRHWLRRRHRGGKSR